MREGDRYPELRHMNLEPIKFVIPHDPGPDWSLPPDQRMQVWREQSMTTRQVDGVRIVMPREDFERMMSIYQSHYHAVGRNPAVAEAWHQYRMLVALTGTHT